jgi:hypothetical protein
MAIRFILSKFPKKKHLFLMLELIRPTSSNLFYSCVATDQYKRLQLVLTFFYLILWNWMWFAFFLQKILHF